MGYLTRWLDNDMMTMHSVVRRFLLIDPMVSGSNLSLTFIQMRMHILKKMPTVLKVTGSNPKSTPVSEYPLSVHLSATNGYLVQG